MRLGANGGIGETLQRYDDALTLGGRAAPLNGNAVLRWESLREQSNGVTLRWTARPDVTYWVERCTNLAVGSWSAIANIAVETGTVSTVADIFGAPNAAYRIRPSALRIAWKRVLDNDGQAALAWDLIEILENDLVLVGMTAPTSVLAGTDFDGLILKTNSQGNMLWKRQLGERMPTC